MAIHRAATLTDENILEFLEQHFPWGRQYWQWKYSDPSFSTFYYSEKEGKPRAFLGLMHFDLRSGGRVDRYSWMVDWFASEEGVGEGLGLLLQAMREFKVLCLQGSESAASVLAQLKWERHLVEGAIILPLATRFFDVKETAQRHRFFYTAVRPLFRLVSRLSFRPKDQPGDVAMERIERFERRCDDVWREIEREYGTTTRRNSDYLNYRFTDYPDGQFEKYHLRRNGVLIGYAVLSRRTDTRGLKRGRIVDLLVSCKQESVFPALASALTRNLAQSGVDYADAFLTNPLVLRSFGRCGYVKGRPTRIWVNPRLQVSLNDWYLTLLDCDRAWR